MIENMTKIALDLKLFDLFSTNCFYSHRPPKLHSLQFNKRKQDISWIFPVGIYFIGLLNQKKTETLFSLYHPLPTLNVLLKWPLNELPLIIQYHCHAEKIFVFEDKGERKNNEEASSSAGSLLFFSNFPWSSSSKCLCYKIP